MVRICLTMEKDITKAYELINKAEDIVVLTGAGISAESGVPTYRGEEGLWKNYNPQELATPEAFARNPELVWEWYESRRKIMKNAKPNLGHLAITTLEREKRDFVLITQNVDGLHFVAGTRNVIELHGSLWEIKCVECERIEKNYQVPLPKRPPICNVCDTVMRPNTVWFGEIIPMERIDRCLFAIEQCDLLLIVGTSGVVEPAASMGLIAKKSEKPVVEINVEITPGTGLYDATVIGKSGEVLPLLVEQQTSRNRM